MSNMYPTSKYDVDKHVEECLKRINNEVERNIRSLSFAKQYMKIERYEEARRYIFIYLNVRPNSPEAHALLGKIYEKLGKKEAAIQAYSTSLRLDSKQNALVLKVCELLTLDNIEINHSDAKYFCELAQIIDPNNSIVFNLKQRILTSVSDNPGDIQTFILKELESRPTDVRLRVKLLRHLLENNQVREAYKHIVDIESKNLKIFNSIISWYETVAEVLVKYQQVNPTELNWEFWFLSTGTLDKLVSLSLNENLSESVRPTTEYISTLFNFDQTLLKASLNISDCPDKGLIKEFLNHYRAQLSFHFVTLLFKQASKDILKYKDAANMALPLIFLAYHSPLPEVQSMWLTKATENRRHLVQNWRREGAFRCSQVGHIVQAQAKNKKAFILEKSAQYSMGMWREELFQKLFVTRDQKLKQKTSFFLTNQQFIDITIRLPENGELVGYDLEAQLLHPDSLHHQIWICLNNNLAEFKCTVFEGLQFSIKNLKNCGAETLNLLDLQSFLYCCAICCRANFDNCKQMTYYRADKPDVLPAAITQELGTQNQTRFYNAAYKMYNNVLDSSIDQLRSSLVEGLKLLRCVDLGLDVKLLIQLAKIFENHAKRLVKQSEIDLVDARAELYWKSALNHLEKIKNNQAIYYPPNKLFNYVAKELNGYEIDANLEAGKLFVGRQLMKRKEHEKALKMFDYLKDPFASFYQAQIYKTLADAQTTQNKANVTSEMRSQNIILLARARDCFYLTLDRLREPSVDAKHPLNAQLGTEIEKIERLLSRIDPDCTNRNECDGMSDENVASSPDSAGDHYITGLNLSYTNTTANHPHSTPFRADLFKREARPSPERLDAQLRQLQSSKDAAIGQLIEHNKQIMQSLTNLTLSVEELKLSQVGDQLGEFKQNVKSNNAELKTIKENLFELRKMVEEFDSIKTIGDMMQEMKREIADLKRDVGTKQLNDEDIYGLTNECTDFLTSNLASSVYNYPNYHPARLPPNPYVASPSLYPGMYPTIPYGYPMGFPNEPQLLPQPQPQIYNQPPVVSSVLTGQHLLQQQSPQTGFKPTRQPLAPPVNVVITSSDPLPLKAASTVTQPILSVTIPPQHIKKSQQQPHNYQIPLTITSTMQAASPSVLSQPAPSISTQSLLSNVAPPLYSAIAEPKTFGSPGLNRSNVSAGSIDEHDPIPDFKPIIPLPDEITLTTGEENETVLFSEHAKLYRFTIGEWKERGVGCLKILHNLGTNKIRIVMRRDQVHKICANHYLTHDLTLSAMPNNCRAFIWAANDFADGEMQIEKFCVRFKTEDEANKFKVAFDCAKLKLDKNEVKTTSMGGFTFSTPPCFGKVNDKVVEEKVEAKVEVKPASPFAAFTFGKVADEKKGAKVETTIWGNAFKPKVGSWECKSCYTRNDESKTRCISCEGPKIEVTSANLAKAEPKPNNQVWGEAFKPKVNSWECKSCYTRNDESKTRCISCEGPKIEVKPTDLVKNEPKPKNQVWGDAFKPKVDSWECKSCYTRNDEGKTRCISCEGPKIDVKQTDLVKNEPKPKNQVWGDAFKPKVNSWECKSCYTRNDESKTRCISCEGPKIEVKPTDLAKNEPKPKNQVAWGDAFKPKAGEWSCKLCYVLNKPDSKYCISCESPIDDSVPKKETTKPKGVDLSTPGQKFTFGLPITPTVTPTPTTATFSFGQTSTFSFNSATKSEPFGSTPKIESKSTETKSEFVFGSPQKFEFDFKIRSPRKSSSGQKDDDSDNSFVEEEVEGNFKPVIPLPELIDVKTGEEEEVVLYSQRAKLFRFTDGEWKERGVGDLKILRRNDDGKLRVVMRRDQVLKICLNHVLNSDVKYFAKGENAWIFSVYDYSEGVLEQEQFCLRFKTVEIAKLFLKAVNDACDGDNGAKVETVNTKSDDVVIVSETKVTPEEEAEALKLQLPPKFMSYRQLPDCTCEQCKKDDAYYTETSTQTTKPSKIPVFTNATTITSRPASISTPTSIFNATSSSGSTVFGTPKETTSVFTTPKEPNSLFNTPNETSSLSSTPKDTTTPLFSTTKETTSSFNTPKETTSLFNTSKESLVTPSSDTIKSILAKPSLLGSPANSTPLSGILTPISTTTNFFATPTDPKSTFSFSALGSGDKSSIFSGSVSNSGSIFNTGTASNSSPTIFGGKPSIFGQPSTGSIFGPKPDTQFKSGGSLFDTSTTSTTKTSIFGGTPPTFGGTHIFGQKEQTKTPEVTLTPIFGETAKLTPKPLKESDPVVLDCSTGLSFASLAAKPTQEVFQSPKSDSQPNIASSFAFLGAGAPVFGAGKADRSKTGDDGGGGTAEEEYDPHYDPIVPLPEQIVVSTGEEDETIVFNERGKLFRYDATTKEWKERGVGQMKILHHPVNNSYRFLLRREQVHKVVLNQRIVHDLDLQAMSTSDKAWVWAGHNYTDDGLELEKLAIRFKNCDLAKEFRKCVENVLEKIRSEPKVEVIKSYGYEDVSSESEKDDEDDERNIMFTKRCTLSEEINGVWHKICIGDLQVFYDHDLYAARICINDDTGLVVSNTIIGVNTAMLLDESHCTWRAVEWTEDEPRWRNLRATFASTSAAQEFHCNYLEGMTYATEFGIVDDIPEMHEHDEEEEEEA